MTSFSLNTLTFKYGSWQSYTPQYSLCHFSDPISDDFYYNRKGRDEGKFNGIIKFHYIYIYSMNLKFVAAIRK